MTTAITDHPTILTVSDGGNYTHVIVHGKHHPTPEIIRTFPTFDEAADYADDLRSELPSRPPIRLVRHGQPTRVLHA